LNIDDAAEMGITWGTHLVRYVLEGMTPLASLHELMLNFVGGHALRHHGFADNATRDSATH
jgi:hypothetical protein